MPLHSAYRKWPSRKSSFAPLPYPFPSIFITAALLVSCWWTSAIPTLVSQAGLWTQSLATSFLAHLLSYCFVPQAMIPSIELRFFLPLISIFCWENWFFRHNVHNVSDSTINSPASVEPVQFEEVQIPICPFVLKPVPDDIYFSSWKLTPLKDFLHLSFFGTIFTVMALSRHSYALR